MTKKVQVFLLNSRVSQQSMVLLTQLYVSYCVCHSEVLILFLVLKL